MQKQGENNPQRRSKLHYILCWYIINNLSMGSLIYSW